MIARGPELDHAAQPSTVQQHASRDEPSQQLPDREGRGTADAYPAQIRRKYYVVEAEAGSSAERAPGAAKIFSDPKGEYLAFKDTGDRLTTRIEAPEVARDMIAVAAHRSWSSVRVSGSETFRREAWLAASTRGIEVMGYEPTDLDRAVLMKRAQEDGRSSSRTDALDHSPQAGGMAPSRANEEQADRREPARVDYDAGITGRLLETGAAPYRNTPGGKKTPYLDLEGDDGRRQRIWGTGLEGALRDAKADAGDRIRVRRDGVELVAKEVEVVNARTGEASRERREFARNRWIVAAEKFRTTDRRDAVKIQDLAAAHSQLAVLEKATATRFPGNERARSVVLEAARERLGAHLETGRRIKHAQIRANDPERAPRAVLIPERSPSHDRHEPKRER